MTGKCEFDIVVVSIGERSGEFLLEGRCCAGEIKVGDTFNKIVNVLVTYTEDYDQIVKYENPVEVNVVVLEVRAVASEVLAEGYGGTIIVSCDDYHKLGIKRILIRDN